MRLEKRHRLIFVAMAIGLAGACAKQVPEEVDSETVVTVKTAPATIGNIRGVIHATGVVVPAPGAELVVVPPETARIAEIARAAGDRVRQGDVLVRFEIPNSAAEMERQQAEVNRAQAALDNARFAQTRARDLFDRGVAARREVEDGNRAVSEAEAALAQARASLVAAQAVAGRATVRATFDGVVAQRLHNPGDLVEATASDHVLRVIDPRRLEVVASVPLADASRVVVGALARLVDAPASDREVALKVLTRPVSVEAGTATVPVRLALGAEANLPDGTPVQVDIEAEQHTNVVLIPTVAIVREGDATAVFVVMGEKAQRRPVQIGLANGMQVEIVTGVTAGEMVIIDGQAGLPDDAAVTVTTELQTDSAAPAPAATEKDGAK
jgi:membrane fusion protein, multidrug efflux system